MNESNASFMAPQNQPSLVDSGLVDLNGYVCEEADTGKHFIIKHREDTSKRVFEITLKEENDKVEFEGLP